MKKMIFEAELKVLEVLWNDGDTTARDLAIKLNDLTSWSTTTTYTVIKRCIEKGLIERTGKNFMCHVNITREEARKRETGILIDKMFNGSVDLLLELLTNEDNVSEADIA